MPDDAIEETPPVSADGLPTVNQDGSVTTDRPGWVWCRDTDTGHRFDVRSNRLPRRGVEVVPNVPVNYGRAARAPKPFVAKDGGPATPQQRPAEVASGDEARAEQIADQQATEQAVSVERAADPNDVARSDAGLTVATADTDPKISGAAGSTTNETKTRKGAR